LNYASTGVGSASHLAAELFKTRAGVQLQHIPFRGSAPRTNRVARRPDRSHLCDLAERHQPYRHAARSAPLAVASGKRAPRLPNLPTLAEAGVPGVEADAWFALFAPAKTPAAILERLHRAVSAGLTTDAATKAVAAQGMALSLRTPAELAAWLPGEVAKWAAVIKTAGVVAE
jgi:tripartite-type tricarboxylate transporter receptor subunit TctC